MKSNYRDYATAAFRYWAMAGCPTEDEVKRYASRGRGAMADLLACARCMVEWQEKKPWYADAVKAVYLAEPGRVLGRGDISALVVKFSLAYPASERSVYGWLYAACRDFADKRGLRVDQSR